MGSKLSLLCVSKKQPKQTQSPLRTSQEMESARRTSKLIYPPLSSIPNDESRRSLRTSGRLIYEPVYMKSSYDDIYRQFENPNHRRSSNFSNHYNRYDDGTFSVLSRYPIAGEQVFRI